MSTSSAVVRIFVVALIVATALTTHWLDRSLVGRDALRASRVDASEMSRAAEWLNDYYAAPDGLDRPSGLVVDGHPDYSGIGAWLFDWYLRARLNGSTEADARALVISGLRATPAWQAKHPGAGSAGR